jgi:hypothetical protein
MKGFEARHDVVAFDEADERLLERGHLLGIAGRLNDRIEHRKHVLLPELLELYEDALLHFGQVNHGLSRLSAFLDRCQGYFLRRHHW